MQRSKPLPLLLLTVYLAGCSLFSYKAKAEFEGFDFKYSAAGALDNPVVQVFNDGSKTYFMFREQDNYPKIYVMRNGKEASAQQTVNSPYVVVQGLYKEYVVKEQNNRALVHYTGTELVGQDPQPSVVKSGPVTRPGAQKIAVPLSVSSASDMKPQPPLPTQPAKRVVSIPSVKEVEVPFAVSRSKLGPKGKASMENLLAHAKEATSITITGTPDRSKIKDLPSARAETIKKWLTDRGVSADIIEVNEGDEPRTSDEQVYYSVVEITSQTQVQAQEVRRPLDPAQDQIVDLFSNVNHVQARSYIKQIGASLNPIGNAVGKGTNEDLVIALRRIIPTGWRLVGPQSLSGGNISVSWRGGKVWPSVLEDIARAIHVTFTVDWKLQQVSVDYLN